jgi:hypothetical protein
MTSITSSPELRRRLAYRDVNFGQIIVIRSALRVLPYCFFYRVSDKWIEEYALTMFRSAVIGWATKNFFDYDHSAAAQTAHVFAKAAYTAARLEAKTPAATDADPPFALSAGLKMIFHYQPSAAVKGVAFAVARSSAAWRSLNADFAKLDLLHELNLNSRLPNSPLSGAPVINEKLWPEKSAKNWPEIWRNSVSRLLILDPSYQVWIDWYNRRIEGHDVAFDIPDDVGRTHDKAILARLVDATDEDFWGKGATYVNTKLQRWIDEARLTAELESIVRKLEVGATTQFGSPQARETLAAFRTKLEAALGNQVPAHTPIGHNHPPEGIDPAEAPILPPALREEARAMLVTLDQPTPNSLDVAKTLTRWSRLKSTFQHDEFSKNFSGELGTSAARGIVLILTTLCLLGLAWLKAVLGI